MDFIEYDELKEKFSNFFDFEDFDYFYHMTENGNGEVICENGLMMVDKDIYKTLIKIEPEDVYDFDKFLETGKGNTDFRKEMVIIKTPKEETDYLVSDNSLETDDWTCLEKANYLIYPKDIAGYINIEDKCFYENYNSLYPLTIEENNRVL
ncbi:MAG: hypothetical protein ACI31R_00290 [Bacilli bacterium]